MLSTMQDAPLLISGILRHGQDVYGDSRVITIVGPAGESVEATFAEVASRAEQLAKALERLGIGDGDRVGTFLWNNQTHLEAYLGVPGIGAVLHTLNLRLFPEQLAFVINHAEDQVIIVDATLVPLLARVRDQLTTVKHIVVAGAGGRRRAGRHDRLRRLAGRRGARLRMAHLRRAPGRGHVLHVGHHRQPQGRRLQPPVDLSCTRWPSRRARRSASTSGTGSSRSCPCSTPTPGGPPTAAFLTGADMIMPQQFLQAEPLAAMIERHRPTLSAGVPTIWSDLLALRPDPRGRPLVPAHDHRRGRGGAPTAHRAVPGRAGHRDDPGLGDDRDEPPVCPGPAAAGSLTRGGDRLAGEDGPGGARSRGPGGGRGRLGPARTTACRWASSRSAGRGSPAPTTRTPSPERFHDGWLRTGDIGSLDGRGYMQISDRTKDVIKSGGEWISSVELENEVMAHPGRGRGGGHRRARRALERAAAGGGGARGGVTRPTPR